MLLLLLMVQKPDISSLIVSNCKAYMHNPDAKQKDELHKKSTACIFIEYPTTKNGFKLFNTQSKCCAVR